MMEPSDYEQEKIERLRRAMYSRKLSEDLGERPRRAMSPDRELVGNDWVAPERGAPSSVVAPRVLSYTRGVLWWLLVSSVVFFLGAVAFFGYYFVLGGGSLAASPSNIDIAVSGPTQIAGGEATKLQIVITNRNRVPLQLAELVIKYPPGTRSPVLSEDSSQLQSCSGAATTAAGNLSLSEQRICLGTIDAGATKQGTVSAIFAGTQGEHESVGVELEYRIQGSNSVFVASSDYDLLFGSSPLSVSVEGNTQTISGQPVQLSITVSSNATERVRDALLHVDLPFGFKLTTADPKQSSDGLWELGDIGPGGQKVVTLRGVLSGQSGDQRTFRVDAGTRTSATSTAISTLLASNAFSMEVAQPFLGLSVLVNQSSTSSVIVSPGENVNVAVTYQNNLGVDITDAVIVARLSGIQIDGTTVRSSDGFFRSTDDTVLWDKNTTAGVLSRLSPGQQGAVSFSFQMPTSESLKSIKNPRLDISVNAAGKRLSETGVPQNLQSVTQQTIRLASDLQINAQGLYYASPIGSSGPIPPKANTETTYALVFTVTNTTNTVSNAVVTAVLPSYVRWVGSYAPAAENLTFDQTSGTFTWKVGDIAPGVGLNGVPPKQIAIAIGFTPSTSQIGQQPILVREITLKGTDAATGAIVTRTTSPDVTTNLAIVSKSSQEAIVGSDPGFSPANATVVK